MTKKLNTAAITSELAGSGFFRPATERPSEEEPQERTQTPSLPAEKPARKLASTPASSIDSKQSITSASKEDSTGASKHARSQASQQSRKPARRKASGQDGSLSSTLAESSDLADAIYRVVKKPGKEISYVRMTDREKNELSSVLAGIVQNYGYKVTETELIRIAICGLLAEFAETGDDSLLMRVVVELKD
jgi:hypothetical protein